MAKAEPIVIEVITPDKMALANQRDYWKEQAMDALQMWNKTEDQLEALADKLAEQALINEELRARVTWYRNLASRQVVMDAEELEACETSEGFDRLIGAKLARLLRMHPLNQVG